MANKFAFGLVLSGAVAAAGITITQKIQEHVYYSTPAPVAAEVVTPEKTSEAQGTSHAETLRMADEASLKRIANQINGTPTWEGPAFDEVNKKYQ
jgi:hypothetical protein